MRGAGYSTAVIHAILAIAVALFATQGLSEVAQSVAQAAQRLVTTHRTPGVAYAVVQNGELVGAGSAGVRDLATGAPVSLDTLFRIGSITKVFTAVAVMQLAEQGLLSLDERLATFQPRFPNAASITIRDLLMHRSGIPNYLDAALADGRAQSPTTPAQIVASVAKLAPESAPGTRFSYSNTNYVLLGLIVEHVSGMTLHAYYAKYIFGPAAMPHTFAGTAPAEYPLAVGYMLSGGTTPQAPGDMSWYYACGDILSTAQDMARFDIALMNGRLLRPSSLATMINSALPSTLGRDVAYGLGLEVTSVGDVILVGHHGGLPGFEAADVMVLKDRFAVITLGNDFSFPTEALMSAALKRAYPAQTAAAIAQQVSDTRATAAKVAPLTKRFSAFLASLLAGKIPDDPMRPQLKAALTPSLIAQIQQKLASTGTLERLQFVSDDEVGGYHRYHYTALFSGGNQPITFVLDSNGAIAGLFLN